MTDLRLHGLLGVNSTTSISWKGLELPNPKLTSIGLDEYINNHQHDNITCEISTTSFPLFDAKCQALLAPGLQVNELAQTRSRESPASQYKFHASYYPTSPMIPIIGFRNKIITSFKPQSQRIITISNSDYHESRRHNAIHHIELRLHPQEKALRRLAVL